MTRHRPPDRRDGELVTFDHDGVRYTAQFSRALSLIAESKQPKPTLTVVESP